MKKKMIAALITALLALGLLPAAALAAAVADNPAGTTVPMLNAGDTMANNYGTVEANYGTVTNNYGTVETNYATVTQNHVGGIVNDNVIGGGTLLVNDGMVNQNTGTVETNTGTVETNTGTVETNTGTVETNTGTVETNTGRVETNYDRVETNYDRVETNYGTVETNNGTVTGNYDTVTTNESGGVVYNAGGTVDSNSGVVYESVTISGAQRAAVSGLTTGAFGVQFAPDGTGEGQAVTVTLTPIAGYFFDQAPTTNKGTPVRRGAGYEITNFTGPAEIGLSLKSIADTVPRITPAQGVYAQGQSVSITSESADAEIYYTTDGSAPNAANGTRYKGAFRLAPGDTTIMAVAVLDGLMSNAAQQTYHIHSFGTEWKRDGSDHWYACVCGEKSDLAAHTAGGWVTNKEPSEAAEGSQYRACTVCGYEMERAVIAKLAPPAPTPTPTPTPTSSPKTDDGTGIWPFLLLAAAAGITLTVAAGRRRARQ